MLKVLAVIGAIVAAPGVAQSAQCVPLANYDAAIAGAGIPRSAIVTAQGADFVVAYSSALGFPVPVDSNPVGMFFITGPKVVLVAIVEAEGCVKYATRVPLWKHQQALAGI